MRIRLAALVGLALLLSTSWGCATIVQGTTQKVRITSEPSGAAVIVYDSDERVVAEDSTPCQVRLDRGEGFYRGAEYKVSVRKAGYGAEEKAVGSELSMWYLGGNFVFGGLIGWFVVDPASGAMWKLDPDKVHIDLTRR